MSHFVSPPLINSTFTHCSPLHLLDVTYQITHQRFISTRRGYSLNDCTIITFTNKFRETSIRGKFNCLSTSNYIVIFFIFFFEKNHPKLQTMADNNSEDGNGIDGPGSDFEVKRKWNGNGHENRCDGEE